jgi:SAM-dependent methyltransferase
MEGRTRYEASDGASYEVFLGRWSRRLAMRLADFASFSGDGDLLDVGCGTGSLVFALAERWPGRRIVGIDLAEPYLDFARQREGAGSIEFRRADASSLPFPDASFAGAAAQLVLNFLPDPARALREMRRVTRPGGVLAAAVWDFRGGLVFQRILWDTAAGIDPGAGIARDRLFSGPLTTREPLVAAFADAGLRDVSSSSLTILMEYADFSDYWKPLLGGQGPVGAYMAGLREELRARIEAAVRAAYLSGAPDGPRSMTATAWAVRGTV